MRGPIVVVALPLMVVSLSGAGHQQPPPSQPRLTTGVELVQIDVSVLDRRGDPIRGLKPQDFVLIENGKPQEIRGFVPIELPSPIQPTAPWIREVGPDVVGNSGETQRLVIVLMDDGTTGVDEGEARLAKMIARAAIDQLGPSDLGAVVFTYMGRAQNFTSDRRELLAAVDSYTPRATSLEPPSYSATKYGPPLSGPPLGCAIRRGGCAGSALQAIATFLRAAPAGRKLVIYIGAKPDVPIPSQTGDYSPPVADMFRALHEANVEVNAFDSAGLKTYAATAADASLQDKSARVAGAKNAKEAIQMLAEHTGGRAVTDTNAPEAAAADIFRRNSAYYLVGFQSSDSKSTGFRKIEVRVNRPDVDVRARSGYYRAKRIEPARATDAAMVDRALANGVAATDVAVQVNIAMMPMPGRREASVFVTAGLRQSSDFAAERVTVAVAAFDTDWSERGRQQQSFDIPARPPEFGTELYDVHSRLFLRPGRYEIRVAAESRGRSGSVIKNIDVPNFEDAQLSLSSVLIERLPAIAIKNSANGDIVPVVPTSLRVFGPTDRASMFVRLLQGGKKPVVPVAAAMRIVDARNSVTFEAKRHLPIDQFSPERTADYRLDIPLDRLAAGDYLLQVDALAGDRTTSRYARFTVR